MKLGEFIDGVGAYDVRLPRAIRQGSVNVFYQDLLGLDAGGTGNRRDYTARNVRQLVSWLTISRLTGGVSGAGNQFTPDAGNQYKADASAELRRHAMRLMAAASEGWIVMSEGGARWSLVPPVSAFAHGAVVIPVPDWLPEHQPR